MSRVDTEAVGKGEGGGEGGIGDTTSPLHVTRQPFPYIRQDSFSSTAEVILIIVSSPLK